MNARDVILLEYSDLEEGLTKAGEHCPACDGGGTKERTLSVTKEDGTLKWYCHRASCGFRGAATTATVGTTPNTQSTSARGFFGRSLARESNQIPKPQRQFIEEKYGITETHIARFQLGWDSETQRLVVPVFNFHGDTLGVVLRTLDKTVKPKTLTHTEKGAISWFRNDIQKGVIIVEDQLSAIRCSDYMNSVALLGTHLNEERLNEIAETHQRPVFLALDADAWNVAVAHALKARAILPIQLVRLKKDIKDMTKEETDELFSTL